MPRYREGSQQAVNPPFESVGRRIGVAQNVGGQTRIGRDESIMSLTAVSTSASTCDSFAATGGNGGRSSNSLSRLNSGFRHRRSTGPIDQRRRALEPGSQIAPLE